jgi:hypothetical protein
MSLASWWKSLGQGTDAADMIIQSENTDISDESLYALAEKAGVPNPKTFVKAIQEELDDHERDQWIKEHGSNFQKFDRGLLIDEEKHPILKKILRV